MTRMVSVLALLVGVCLLTLTTVRLVAATNTRHVESRWHADLVLVESFR